MIKKSFEEKFMKKKLKCNDEMMKHRSNIFFFIISNQIELKTPATSQVEDNFKGFLTVATKNWIEQNWLEIFEEFDFFLSCSHFFVVVLLSFNFILCLTVFIFMELYKYWHRSALPNICVFIA